MSEPPELPPWVNLPVRRKVMIYVLGANDTVLTFTQRDSPDAGAQIPAGTVEPGESTAAAAARELEEETGLAAASTLVHFADSFEDVRELKPEIHWRSWFYTLSNGFPPASWTHVEPRSSGNDITADFEWMDAREATKSLIAGHGTQLELARKLTGFWRNDAHD